ncbi:MAG: ribosome-associated translation inhibitor RaiA [Clostridia bacterium]|jgi:putative sigma-54 modulation protein|nr:ribosome-associated translation inhibitor RaiA [Clostridia bacterium]MDD4572274.1 ribosome-associated translation inhibitor RaiA [Clostridia bacterium]
MLINVKGRNLEITNAMREYVEKRLNKFDKMVGGLDEAFVTMSVQKDRHKVEVTMPLNGVILRGEEEGVNMYACIDDVVEKLERQVRKHKTRLAKKMREGSINRKVIMEIPEQENESRLVRTKTFDIKPLAVEEAIMQMDLLGHNFFVFVNDETDNINVVYRRKDGNYGLLQPEV